MSTPRLFTPITLRSLEIRNRLWVAPMCQYSAHSTGDEIGVPNDWHRSHWGALGRGGWGVIVVEATAVTPEGRISPHCLGIWNDRQEDAFRTMLPFARSHGARVAVQLAHAGRKASTHPWLPEAAAGSVPPESGGWQSVGPGAEPFPGLAAPRELTT